MVETMVVGLMVVGAVMIVHTMDAPTAKVHEPFYNEDFLESWLATYAAFPGDNTTIRYDSKITEWSVNWKAGQTQELRQRLISEWPDAGIHLNLQHKNDPIAVYGRDASSPAGQSFAQHEMIANWGTTLIRPGMSHYNLNQAIDLNLLPLTAGGPLPQTGIPYTVTARLVDGDGRSFTQSSYGEILVEHQDHLSPLNVTFQDGAGGKLNEAGMDELIPRGVPPTEHVWQVHINLTSTQANPGEVWWDKTHILRVMPPAGWSYDALQPHDWTRLPAWDAQGTDSIIRLKYTDDRAMGPDAGVDVTVNLTRPVLSDSGQSQVVTAVTEGQRTSNNHLVLRSIAATRELPFGVYTSTSQPWMPDEWSPFRVHVTNPRTEDYDVKQVAVTFTRDSYQFTQMDQELPDDWQRHRVDNDTTTFYWNGTKPLGSGASWEVDFPVRAHRVTDKAQIHEFGAPVARALDPDGDAVSAVVAHRIGPSGHFEVVLPPMLELGVHDVAVANNDRGAPPGQGSYTVRPDVLGLLDEVQTARYSMGLEAYPPVHSEDESVVLSVETGRLLETLRALDGVNPDTVRLNVTATDLWGWFTGDYHEVDEFPLSLDAGSQVRGLDFVDTNGDSVLDVVVTYADGNVAALDGNDPRENRFWKHNLGTRVTSAPVLLDVSGDGREELVVVGSHLGENYLFVVDVSNGAVLEEVDLDGYPSHLLRSECRDGVWFQASKFDEVDVKSPLGGQGFLSAVPDWTRLGFWEPGEDAVYGETHTGANPFAVREGVFAPFERCSVVQALGVGSGVSPVLRLVRVDAGDLLELWDFQGEGLLRGLWVDDVSTTPIETPSARLPSPGRSDEIVLVTDEFGLEVLGGWAEHARPKVVVLPGWLDVDELIGLSWVDHDTGYVASKAGFLWRTVDGGGEWVKVQPTPIIAGATILEDFVFGGNGKGLFENDENHVAFFDGVSLGDFKNPTEQFNDYKGLAYTANRPGVIGYSQSRLDTAIYEWDGEDGPLLDEPINPIPCDCDQAVGHDAALAGIKDATVYVATPTVNRQLELDADAVVAQADGSILAYDGSVFIYNNTTHQTEFQDLDAGGTPVGGVYRGGADMIHGSSHYTLSGGGVVKQEITTNSLVGVSSGNGARWLVTESGLIRDQVPASHWFAIDPGADVWDGAEVTLHNPTEGPGGVAYWIHTPDGAGSMIAPDKAHVVSWQNGSWLETKGGGGGSVPPAGPGRSLVIEGTFGERTLDASRDIGCTECLAPLGWPGAVEQSEGVWADPDGVLPQVRLPEIGPSPVLVGRAGAAPLVASGSLAGIDSYGVDTGFTIKKNLAAVLDDPESIKLGVAKRTGLDGVLWAEAGDAPDPIGGLSGILGGPSNRAEVPPTLARLDPGTGALTCVASWPDTDRIGGRILATNPADPESFFSGSGLGRVGLMESGDCGPEWEESVAETGSRILLTVPPAERDWLGARIYLVDVVVDIDLLDEVRVQLMAFSVRNDWDMPRATVAYQANLFLWLVYD